MLQSMTRLVGGILFSVLLCFSVGAQQSEIEGTISSQIEAFKADDFEQAFTFATPNLRRMFQTPENFQRMVIGGYPMVWRPAEVEYLELREYEGAMFQKVRIIDQKGAMHTLMYRMIETPEGWRIGGVQILKEPSVNA